jgi:hypothetical protein
MSENFDSGTVFVAEWKNRDLISCAHVHDNPCNKSWFILKKLDRFSFCKIIVLNCEMIQLFCSKNVGLNYEPNVCEGNVRPQHPRD